VTAFTVVSDTQITATLGIGAAATTGNRQIGVMGLGTTNTVTFTVQGGTFGFSGPTPALTTSPADTSTKTGLITVTNTASGGAAGPLTFTAAPSVVQTPAGAKFSIVAGGTCASGTVLAPGANCTINVQYAPGGVTTTATGHVTIQNTGGAASSVNSPSFTAN
jgi:hypothetical protein